MLRSVVCNTIIRKPHEINADISHHRMVHRKVVPSEWCHPPTTQRTLSSSTRKWLDDGRSLKTREYHDQPWMLQELCCALRSTSGIQDPMKSCLMYRNNHFLLGLSCILSQRLHKRQEKQVQATEHKVDNVTNRQQNHVKNNDVKPIN